MAPDPKHIRAQRFPLHHAVTEGASERVNLILASEKNRHQLTRRYDNSGQAPLHLAASHGRLRIVLTLLEFGAKINDVDAMRQTALHYSILTRDERLVLALIQKGADINLRRLRDGWTPIFLAAVFGLSKIARVLVDNGADVLLADNLGLTPEDWAAKYRNRSVQTILRSAPRKITEDSGKRYKEDPGEKVDLPVEFDENISNLLLKIEQKRKDKMRRMEGKLAAEEAQVEENRTEAELETTANSILDRQKRFDTVQKDKENRGSIEHFLVPSEEPQGDSDAGAKEIASSDVMPSNPPQIQEMPLSSERPLKLIGQKPVIVNLTTDDNCKDVSKSHKSNLQPNDSLKCSKNEISAEKVTEGKNDSQSNRKSQAGVMNKDKESSITLERESAIVNGPKNIADIAQECESVKTTPSNHTRSDKIKNVEQIIKEKEGRHQANKTTEAKAENIDDQNIKQEFYAEILSGQNSIGKHRKSSENKLSNIHSTTLVETIVEPPVKLQKNKVAENDTESSQPSRTDRHCQVNQEERNERNSTEEVNQSDIRKNDSFSETKDVKHRRPDETSTAKNMVSNDASGTTRVKSPSAHSDPRIMVELKAHPISKSEHNCHPPKESNTSASIELNNSLSNREKKIEKQIETLSNKPVLPSNEESLSNRTNSSTVENPAERSIIHNDDSCQDLPDSINDEEFEGKIKVFNNYRQFGFMYSSKGNSKRAEWAFSNGIKQAGVIQARSKEQQHTLQQTQAEFRVLRARTLKELKRIDEARMECLTVLSMDPGYTPAALFLSSL